MGKGEAVGCNRCGFASCPVMRTPSRDGGHTLTARCARCGKHRVLLRSEHSGLYARMGDFPIDPEAPGSRQALPTGAPAAGEGDWARAVELARQAAAAAEEIPAEYARQAQPFRTEAACEHDFFISYKSQQANTARALAEWLMAAGVRVWMAEYRILLGGYSGFAASILAGIDASARGLLLTSKAYAADPPPHCRQEVAWLQQRFAGQPARILEIQVEPNDARSTYGIPAASPLLSCTGGGELPLQAIRELLARHSDLRPDWWMPSPPADGERTMLSPRCRPRIAMSSAGFEVASWERDPQDGTDVIRLHQRSAGLDVHLTFDDSLGSMLQLYRATPGLARDLGDRGVYTMQRHAASEWMRRMPAEEQIALVEGGLHLLWVGDRAHLALTHRAGPVWMRKALVVLEDPSGAPPTEVAVTVSAGATSLPELLRALPAADALIASLRTVETPIPTTTPRLRAAAAATQRLYAFLSPLQLLAMPVMAYLLYKAWSTHGSLFGTAGARGASGLALAVGGCVLVPFNLVAARYWWEKGGRPAGPYRVGALFWLGAGLVGLWWVGAAR